MPLDGESFRGPDPRPEKRKKDTDVMKKMHKKGLRCEITGKQPASLHHVYPRGQGGDDVPENLVALEGTGTTGLHGRVTENDHCALSLLGDHILLNRPDVIFYVQDKLGEEAGRDWLRRKLFISL